MNKVLFVLAETVLSDNDMAFLNRGEIEVISTPNAEGALSALKNEEVGVVVTELNLD